MSEHGTVPEFPKYPGEGAESNGPPPQPSAPDVPSSITTAVKLMWVGAALSVAGVAVSILMLDTFKESIADSLRESDPNVSQTSIDAAYMGGIAAAVVVGLVSVGLWAWMAWKNGQGKSWARIVATALGGINVVFLLIGFAAPGANAVTLAFNALTLILAVVILVLLWKKDSSQYYDAVTQRQMI